MVDASASLEAATKLAVAGSGLDLYHRVHPGTGTREPRCGSRGHRARLRIRRDRRSGRLHHHERARGQRRQFRRGAAAGSASRPVDPGASHQNRSRHRRRNRSGNRSRADQGRRATAAGAGVCRLGRRPPWAAGARRRQSARPRELGVARCDQRRGTTARKRVADDLSADRCVDQSRQQRRPAHRYQRPHRRDQHLDLLAERRQRRSRLRGAEQYRQGGVSAAQAARPRQARRHRHPRANDYPAAGRCPETDERRRRDPVGCRSQQPGGTRWLETGGRRARARREGHGERPPVTRRLVPAVRRRRGDARNWPRGHAVLQPRGDDGAAGRRVNAACARSTRALGAATGNPRRDARSISRTGRPGGTRRRRRARRLDRQWNAQHARRQHRTRGRDLGGESNADQDTGRTCGECSTTPVPAMRSCCTSSGAASCAIWPSRSNSASALLADWRLTRDRAGAGGRRVACASVRVAWPPSTC